MIPRSSVLNALKDSKSGEVIDFDWGVDQWSSLLLKSDEQHPVDLEEPAISTHGCWAHMRRALASMPAKPMMLCSTALILQPQTSEILISGG